MNKKKVSLLVLGVLIVASAAAVSLMVPATNAGTFNCKIVSCPAPACDDDQHLQVPPGQCCPVCVPN